MEHARFIHRFSHSREGREIFMDDSGQATPGAKTGVVETVQEPDEPEKMQSAEADLSAGISNWVWDKVSMAVDTAGRKAADAARYVESRFFGESPVTSEGARTSAQATYAEKWERKPISSSPEASVQKEHRDDHRETVMAGNELPSEEADQMKQELEQIRNGVAESIKGTDIAATPIGKLFLKSGGADFETGGAFIVWNASPSHRDAFVALAQNIGYTMGRDGVLRRGAGEEMTTAGGACRMDLHEFTGQPKPRTVADKRAVFAAARDLMKTWEGRFAKEANQEFIADFNAIEKQEDTGEWKEDAAAQGRFRKEVVDRIPSGLANRVCGKALFAISMKKDAQGNLLFAVSDKAQFDNFKHFHQAWPWPGYSPTVKVRYTAVPAETGQRNVPNSPAGREVAEYGMIVTTGGFESFLRDIHIRLAGEQAAGGAGRDGVGGSVSAQSEDDEEPEEGGNDVETLGKNLGKLLERKGGLQRKQKESREKKEKVDQDIQRVTAEMQDHRAKAAVQKQTVEEYRKRLDEANRETNQDPDRVRGLGNLVRSGEGFHETLQQEVTRCEMRLESLRKQNNDLESAIKTAGESETALNEEIEKRVKENVGNLSGDYVFYRVEFNQKEEEINVFTLDKTVAVYDDPEMPGGGERMSLSELLALNKKAEAPAREAAGTDE